MNAKQPNSLNEFSGWVLFLLMSVHHLWPYMSIQANTNVESEKYVDTYSFQQPKYNFSAAMQTVS